MIAEVIVDITNSTVDKVFDYVALDDTIVGQRVMVPFGRRNIQGFVIALKQFSDLTDDKLKTILYAIDDYPVILPEHIELMHFMVKKYHLRFVDCLRLFIPSELRSDDVKPLIKTYVYVQCNTQEYAKSVRKNAKNIIALCNFLVKGERYLKSELTKKYSQSAVNKLIEGGILQIEQVQQNRTPQSYEMSEQKHKLTPMQKRAVDAILNKNDTYLLFGVTGSGKTEVYMSVIENIVNSGKNAIMLVPEISLTPQVLAHFRARFGNNVAILHSGLSVGERFDEWRRVLLGEARIVVGARSAIFAPIQNLGIIIIDEEHETSYISESNPRYNTFDIAKFRSEYNKCSLVLASATPDIDSYQKAINGEYKLLTLPTRINDKPMPRIQIVDMLSEIRNGNAGMFSSALLYELDKCIKEKHQAMFFINRRGYSSFMRCTNCGYIPKCTDCDVTLVYHKKENKLKCHYCGKRFKALTICPQCKSTAIRNGAIGTEQVVAQLHEMYPQVPIYQMDNDTTRTKNAYQKILSQFGKSKPGILVGTQMIAKGHDFSDVTLVGIIDADQSLYHSDYKSTEKTFELITQMAGRAGRDKAEGKVILQTYAPRHYAYRFIANYDYKSFFDKELSIRKNTMFPPFTTILRLLFSSQSEEIVREITKLCYTDIKHLRDIYLDDFVYLDAMKSPITKIKNKIRYQILMRIKHEHEDEIIQKLYEICDKHTNAKVSMFVEINPQNLS